MSIISNNRTIMVSCLKSNVVPVLKEFGFTGSFPHFRRFNNDSIDLITFQTNKYGGSFLVEVSAGFPFADDKNYVLNDNMTEKTLNVYSTNIRYRLPGMFNGPWFYYCDVYKKKAPFRKAEYYDDLDNSRSIPDGYLIVQEFNEETADIICAEVNKQLKTAFVWLEKFKNEHKKISI